VVEIDQDAFVSLARFAQGTETQYRKYGKGNGVYLFVIDGCLRIGREELAPANGLALYADEPAALQALAPSRVLGIEVPL
jgi:hypothetical protein